MLHQGLHVHRDCPSYSLQDGMLQIILLLASSIRTDADTATAEAHASINVQLEVAFPRGKGGL